MSEDVRALLESWIITMEAARTPLNTVKGYSSAAMLFLRWCEQNHVEPDLRAPDALRGWLKSMADAGLSGGTINARRAAVRAWGKWMVEEGEITEFGAGRVARAAADEHVPDALTERQVEALLRACAADKSFYGIRDEAMFSLMFDSLIRSDECVSMRMDGDVNLRNRLVRVRRGKGGRERFAAFSAQTARRLDRYERNRRRHKHADAPEYWLGKQGPIGYRGLYDTFRRRCVQSGISAHPHMLRAGGAVRWRRRGGTTESLMTVAGWRDRRMVMHYTQAADIELALDEARRLFE